LKFFQYVTQSTSNFNLFFFKNERFKIFKNIKVIESLVPKKVFNLKKNQHPSFYRIQTMTKVVQLTNLFLKCGKKLKYQQIIFNLFSILFFLVKKKNNEVQKFTNFYKFFEFAKTYKNFYNISFFLNTICSFLAPRFNLQCLSVPKKYRKKFKCRYLFRLKYVKFFNESKKCLKWLVLYSNQFFKYKVESRLLNSLLLTFFEEKKSFLYLKKIAIYKKMLIKSKVKSTF